jgi:hypothetical protein
MDKKDRLASPLFNPSTFIAHRRIAEAEGAIDQLHRTNGTTEQQVLRLLELDRDQGQQIAKLQAVVWVLMQMLTERGQLDAVDMNGRIAEALAKLEADPSWSRMRGA